MFEFEKFDLKKLLIYYLGSKIFIYVITLIISMKIFQIFSLQEIVGTDFLFNDLYYRLENKNIFNNKHFTTEKQVVLINGGSLNAENFRLELAVILKKLNDYNPAAIGIDYEFSKTDKPGTRELINEILGNDKIVAAYRSEYNDSLTSDNYIYFKDRRGDVLFPDNFSVRNYFNHDSTFAFRLAKIAKKDKVVKLPDYQETFAIHYSCYNDGLIQCCDKMNPYWDINFKYFEGNEFLNDFLDLEEFRKQVEGKIVIIGHLGTNLIPKMFDIEDKFKVPVDINDLAIREKTMYGAVIHANAIENILNPKKRFIELSPWGYFVIYEVLYILFLMLFLFVKMGRIFNVFFVIFISLFSLWLILALMQYRFYIIMGSTIFQLFFIEEFSEVIEPHYSKILRLFRLGKPEITEENTD